MAVFSLPDFADHEQVVFCSDAPSGLRAIIAIHDSRLGPALGGCRMYPYAQEDDALRDVLRLSRGMSLKSAMARLPLGGGKAVVIGDPRSAKTPALLEALARAVDRLGGRYIAAEDSGTSVDDMRQMARFTRHVAGISDKPTDDGVRSGDPSPATAFGTLIGIRAAVHHALGRDDLAGLKVAIQGIGHVGYDLARQLHVAGAALHVCDMDGDLLQRAATELGAVIVDPSEIYDQAVDVFAPCAMGAVLDDRTIPRLRARIVAGAANNQLAEARHGEALRARGILYAPDYVINAGGIIDIHHERIGFQREALLAHLATIGENLSEIFGRADREGLPTSTVADRIAHERLQ